MPTTEALLRHGLVRDGAGYVLTLDPVFQGLPDTAHGGAVLAAFGLAAGAPDPRSLHGLYRRRVPLGVPLKLTARREGDAWACALRDLSGTMLADGSIVTTPSLVGDPGAAPPADGHPLPLSASCFACGVDNAFGLRARLTFDDDSVGGTWSPREALAGAGGGVAPVAVTALLDEAAFWLGVLASGESGMTTELAVSLHAPLAFETLTVAGARAAVRQRRDDPRYWDTSLAARDAAGRCVASARITFVAVRGAARRLVDGMLRLNPPEILRRVFPAYA